MTDHLPEASHGSAAGIGQVGGSPTVGDYLGFLAPQIWQRDETGSIPLCVWPPDAFAVAASLLQKTGGYAQVVKRWPPDRRLRRPKKYQARIALIGAAWRKSCQHGSVPSPVAKWWNLLVARGDASLESIQADGRLCEALIQICAAADEATGIVGVPGPVALCAADNRFPREVRERTIASTECFFARAREHLQRRSTLCEKIHPAAVRVLPKAHTPQNGITLRSLTHYLALCPGSEVEARWKELPVDVEPALAKSLQRGLNVLLFPWPLSVCPKDFEPAAPPQGSLENMPEMYAFFQYKPKRDPKAVTNHLRSLIDAAEASAGPVDVVVFPEAALDPKECESVTKYVVRESRKILIAGVVAPKRNYAVISLPYGISNTDYLTIEQDKHHRWLVNDTQIVQYGLGGQLDPRLSWWEEMDVGKRAISFLALHQHLIAAVLICEDLARQDPVADIVRSVGPNLVVALLMDGPQLSARWPARYATSLADDPGSSVLTFSSLGMVSLSRPQATQKSSRVVGLWKDAHSGGPVELDLPEGTDGLVLNLSWQTNREFAADGRCDHGTSCYPRLTGIHPVRREKS